MAKINAPLFSINSSGSLDKSITFRKKSKNQIASKYSKPGNKIPFESSPRQKDQRGIIGLITIAWQSKTDLDKLAWDTSAKDARFKGTGYHYFLHLAKTDLTTYLGLVGYWSMNYNIDDNIPDLSGNNNYGILKPSYPSNSPIPKDSINNKFGKCLYFAISDYLDNDIQLVSSYPFTMSLWFNISTLGLDQTLFSIEDKNTWNIMNSIGLFSDNKLYLRTRNPSAQNFLVSTNVLVSDKWYFVVCVWESSILRYMYLNGIFQNQLTSSFPWQSSINRFSIGRSGDSTPDNYFNGLIDEVRIYNRVLNKTEIQLQYNLFR